MIWLAGLLGDTQVVALVKLMALARSYGVYLRTSTPKGSAGGAD